MGFVAWTIAWNIVGAYSFFKDSYQSCMTNSYELWLMMFISLALQWFLLITTMAMHGAMIDFLKDEED